MLIHLLYVILLIWRKGFHWGIGRHIWDEPVIWLIPALKVSSQDIRDLIKYRSNEAISSIKRLQHKYTSRQLLSSNSASFSYTVGYSTYRKRQSGSLTAGSFSLRLWAWPYCLLLSSSASLSRRHGTTLSPDTVHPQLQCPIFRERGTLSWISTS